MLFLAGELAEKRLARGLKLNYPESIALISSRLQEAAKSKAPPEIKTVTAKVAGFGRSPNLRTQITLDNGQIWEYQDDPDQLLAVGDLVTIKHGTLGSFLLVTPTKVSHRVRRIN